MEENKTTEQLTEEEVSTIYNKLSDADKTSTDALEKAEEETNSTEYSELEKIESDSLMVGVDQPEVFESVEDYKEIFNTYNLTDNDAKIMIDIVDKYKNNVNMDYYTALPKSLQSIADGLRTTAIKNGIKATRNQSAAFLLDELVHDAKMNNAFDTYIHEMNQTALEMDEEYKVLISDAFYNAFNRIDEIELRDPDEAEKLRAVKQAFDDAISFDKQMEYVEKTTGNKLRKYTKRYLNETAYFNNLVNVTDVKIPDIRQLPQIIYKALPQFNIEDINAFIVVICKSVYDINMNNVVELAYVYKMINTIYDYKFTNNYVSEDADKLFGNIAKVITAIINK